MPRRTFLALLATKMLSPTEHGVLEVAGTSHLTDQETHLFVILLIVVRVISLRTARGPWVLGLSQNPGPCEAGGTVPMIHAASTRRRYAHWLIFIFFY